MSDTNHISDFERALGDAFGTLSDSDRNELGHVWMLAGDAAPVDPALKAAARARIAARTRPVLEEPRVIRLVPGWLLRPLAMAACIAALITVGVLQRPTDSIFRAPAGVDATSFVLTDGSAIELSPGSEIRVDEHFGVQNREVRLVGEVFFDVSRQDLPFRIQTENAMVEVLGTAFNIRSWADDGFEDTQVSVTRGLVKVAPSDNGLDVRLSAGEATRISESGVPSQPTAFNEDRTLAWRDGGIALSDEPVSAVLDEVARRFDVRIDAPAAAVQQRISFFKHTVSDVEETLADVTDAAGLRYRRTANGFHVFVP